MKQRLKPELIGDENPKWTAADIKRAVPFSGLPASLQAKLRGQSNAAVTKERITIRLSPDVVRPSALRVTAGKRGSMRRYVTG